jgi:glycosyltransferase involved in cell wall biosynthesis
MKKFVIVPSHNQAEHIHSIIDGYDKQTVPPDAVVFVLDRCFDDSISKIRQMFPKNIKVLYTTTNDSVGFSAGKTRDIGIEFVERNYPDYEMILFTDGDCIPSTKLFETHLDCLNQSVRAAVSCGRRVMKSEDGSIQEDERISASWINSYSFTNTNARLLISKRVTLDSIFTYSCNLAFNKKAIELCKHINYVISNSSRVFNPEFDGSWGGEDNFVSDCLFRTGNDILLTSLEGFVIHQYHTPAARTNIHLKLKILRNLSQRLKTHILGLSIDGSITEFEKIRNMSLMEEDLSNIHCAATIPSEISNIFNSINFADIDIGQYKNQFLAVISRNIDFLPATEQRGKPNRIPEAMIEHIKDISAFVEVYLENGNIKVLDTLDGYSFKAPKAEFISLCRSCG